jgi:hypothetical protein
MGLGELSQYLSNFQENAIDKLNYFTEMFIGSQLISDIPVIPLSL